MRVFMRKTRKKYKRRNRSHFTRNRYHFLCGVALNNWGPRGTTPAQTALFQSCWGGVAPPDGAFPGLLGCYIILSLYLKNFIILVLNFITIYNYIYYHWFCFHLSFSSLQTDSWRENIWCFIFDPIIVLNMKHFLYKRRNRSHFTINRYHF